MTFEVQGGVLSKVFPVKCAVRGGIHLGRMCIDPQVQSAKETAKASGLVPSAAGPKKGPDCPPAESPMMSMGPSC